MSTPRTIVRTGGEDGALARLASAGKGQPAFLAPHHCLAAERFERMAQRAMLAPRMTMSYSLAQRPGRGAGNGAADLTDTAAQARARLNDLCADLGTDCAGVLLDVLCFGKGLQQVETERQWPRRSAKLVLRIALDRLAGVMGLSPQAQGAPAGHDRVWLDHGARPHIVG